jgi:hypothetical protein
MKFFFILVSLLAKCALADPAVVPATTLAPAAVTQKVPQVAPSVAPPVSPTLTPAAQPAQVPTTMRGTEPTVSVVPTPPVKKEHALVLTVWDHLKKSDYDSKVASLLKAELQNCADCVVTNISSYDEKGAFKSAVAPSVLAQMNADSNVILVNFNERPSAANAPVLASIKSARERGILVVFAAGEPASKTESSAPLSQTIAGQIPGALIVGEIGDKDRLLGDSYFGPEMLTAIRPPRDYIGQGLAPAVFAARLTKNFRKRTDWIKYLNDRKISNKKIWLDLNDCFGH